MPIKTIFDSIKARAISLEFETSYYTSSGFVVEKGSQLILTAPVQAFQSLHLEIHRTPQPLKQSNMASCLDSIYTKLHRHGVNQPMGNPLDNEAYAKSVVSLGIAHDGKVYDWVSINRPGNYYLFGMHEHNRAAEDLANPFVVELYTPDCD